MKKVVWERSQKLNIFGNYTILLGCYAGDSLSFIYLYDVRICTQEIWVKTHIFKPGYYEKVWERVPTPENLWECRSHAFPPHYTPGLHKRDTSESVSKIFNRNSISRSATHPQSWNLIQIRRQTCNSCYWNNGTFPSTGFRTLNTRSVAAVLQCLHPPPDGVVGVDLPGSSERFPFLKIPGEAFDREARFSRAFPCNSTEQVRVLAVLLRDTRFFPPVPNNGPQKITGLLGSFFLWITLYLMRCDKNGVFASFCFTKYVNL